MPQTEADIKKARRKAELKLKNLKTHLFGGCSFAYQLSVGPARVEAQEPRDWGEGPYVNFDAIPPVTTDIREVTCGYCKTKLTNELWFKDWKDLTEQEHELLKVLRRRRDERKTRGEADLG